MKTKFRILFEHDEYFPQSKTLLFWHYMPDDTVSEDVCSIPVVLGFWTLDEAKGYLESKGIKDYTVKL